MRKTVQAKIYRPTTTKEERLEYLYEEWNKCLDDYRGGMEYKGLRNNYTLHSALVQDTKKSESKGEEGNPVYLRSQIFTLKKTGNDVAKWFVRIPVEPYEHLWLPLKFAARQEYDLRRGEVKDSQLCREDDGFYVHINIQLPDDTEIPANPTFIGVDVGERNSLVSVALDDGTPTKAEFWSGGRYKQINRRCGDIRRRLQQREAHELLEEVNDKQQRKLDDLRHKHTRQLIDYAEQFQGPVLVMEDLTYIRDTIDYDEEMNRRLHHWAFADLQQKIEYKAREAGIPVVYVNPRKTSAKCHNCLHEGFKEGGQFRCRNHHCPITEYDRDLNAAVNIAQKGAFHVCENTGLGKDRYDDVHVDGAPLTVLQPRTTTSISAG